MDLVTFTALCALHGRVILAPCEVKDWPLPAMNAAVAAHVDLSPWQSLIASAARRFAIPQSWIGAVMACESAGRTLLHGQPITSAAGAMGLMQIMPGTYRDLRQQYGFGPDPYDPRDNIFGGAAYLRMLYDRYGYPDLFAAYQAGPQRLDAYLLHGKPLPMTTRDYLGRIAPGSQIAFDGGEKIDTGPMQNSAGQAVIDDTKAHSNALFFVRHDAPPTRKLRAEDAESRTDTARAAAQIAVENAGALFVPLSQTKISKQAR